MWRYIGLAVAALAIIGLGFSLVDIDSGEEVSASAVLAGSTVDRENFAQATDADRDWQFPQDHGAHPEYQTEWWYYTGNLADEEGRRFGYQFTIFRRAILPQSEVAQPIAESEWRTNQIYLAHFTVTDIADETFLHDSRLARGSAGIAGVTVDDRYRAWLEDWEVIATDDEHTTFHMTADAGEYAVDFTLEQAKPLVLQGQNGLSPKGSTPGNASYYVTMPRLLTEGELTIGDETYTVSGTTWMDHEFSTSALAPGAQGWDWFGLIFDDNTEMMVGRIRLQDGGTESAFGGTYVFEDGSSVYLPASAFTITPTQTWTSPETGATYPVAWEITVDAEPLDRDTPLVLQAEALVENQELVTTPIYWEGAVRITGDVSGYGYAELTGYVETMDGFL